MKIEVRKANLRDCEKITELHYDSEVVGLLSKLPAKLLENFFYINILSDPKYVNWVAVNEQGEILGFLSLCYLDVKPMPKRTRWILRANYTILIASIFDISLVGQVVNYFRGLKYINGRVKRNPKLKFEIQILIVGLKHQGNGVGSKLMLECEDMLGKEVTAVVKTQNLHALKFYNTFKFQLIRQLKCFNSVLYLCERNLS